MSKIKLGIIGAGNIVQKVHLPVLIGLDQYTVAAIFDINSGLAYTTAAKFGIPYVAVSVDELLAHESVETVLIATPNATHFELVSRAVACGKNIICEKPFVVNRAQAESIYQKVIQSESKVLICFTNRFRDEILYLKQLIEADQLGEIIEVKIGWLRANGIPGVGSWHTHKEHAGGGVLLDLGSHLLDLAYWLLPVEKTKFPINIMHAQSTRCKADQSLDASWYLTKSKRSKNPVDVEQSIRTVFQIGACEIQMEASWASPHVEKDVTYLEITGSKKKVKLNTLFGLSSNGERPCRPLSIFDLKNPEKVSSPIFKTEPLVAYINQFKAFSTSLNQQEESRQMLLDAMMNNAIMEATYRSIHEGRLIGVAPLTGLGFACAQAPKKPTLNTSWKK